MKIIWSERLRSLKDHHEIMSNHRIWEMIRSERSYIRMKRSWDPRYHEIQDFIRCKRSWDPRDIEIKDIMRSEISWDLRNNEICEIMRWDMRSWNLRDCEVRYDIRFNESEIWYLIYWIWSFSWSCWSDRRTDKRTAVILVLVLRLKIF